MRLQTRIYRSIRAVSPVLSTLLMIIVSVASSLVTYAWVMGYVGFTATKAGNAVIQSAARDGNDLLVYVQNVGEGAVKLSEDSSVYINNVMRTASINPMILPEGQTATCTIPEYFTDGTRRVKVRVVCSSGTFTETTFNFDV